MALQDAITVNEFTAPLITKQLLDFRNDALSETATFGTASAQNIVNVTGYTFQLIIKRTPIGVRAQDGYPQVFDSDAYELKYSGTILDAAQGTVTFQLDAAATCCYGSYAAEIRWWASGASTSGLPTDRVGTTFNVDRVMDTTYP